MTKKQYSDDDGRTVVNMNVEGFAWYESEEDKKNRTALAKKTPKEKKAIARKTYLSVALPLICLLLGVSAAFFILYYLWL